MNQFILIVNGPIGSGKTWAIDVIMGQYKKIFRLSSNKIKFLISDYTPDRDRNLVQECLLMMADKMLENGMSLILEGGSVTQGNLNKKLEEIGNRHGVKVTSLNIEAPLEVLKARFEERLKRSAERGTKVSVTDDEGFMKRYTAYLGVKKDSDITLDSSIMSADEIAKKIMSLVI